MQGRYLPRPEIAEGHIIFRHGMTDTKGFVASGSLYENHIFRSHKAVKDDGILPFVTDDDVVMVPVYIFGCADLYMPIQGSDYEQAYVKWLENNKDLPEEPKKENYVDDFEKNAYCIVLGKLPKDAPISVNSGTIQVNQVYPYKLNQIKHRILTFGSFRTYMAYYANYQLVNLLNEYYRDAGIDQTAVFSILRLDCNPDEFELGFDEFDPEKVDAQIRTGTEVVFPMFNRIDFPGYNYIVNSYPNYRVLKSTPIITDPNDYGTEVFVRVPGTNVWQMIRGRNYAKLLRIEQLKVTYSKVNKPRGFDYVYPTQEFYANNISEIVKLCALLGEDLDLEDYRARWPATEEAKMSETDSIRFINNEAQQLYEALTISMTQGSTSASLTLTQDELGISPKSTENIRSSRSPRKRNNFCLLDLITTIADIHNSMELRNYESKRYSLYG